MKHLFWTVAALCLLAAPCLAAPLEAYGRLPAMSDVNISPDGARLAYVTDQGAGQRVVVEDVATRKTIAAVSGGKFKIRSVEWADRDNVIVVSSRHTTLRGFSSPTESEYYEGVVLAVPENKVKPLLYEGDAETLPVLRGMPMVRRANGTTQIFTESYAIVDNHTRSSIFRTDLARRRTTLIMSGEPNTEDWLLDRDGKILGRVDYYDRSDVWRILLRRKNGLLAGVDLPEGVKRPRFLGLGRNNTVLVAYDKDDKDLISEVAIDTLTWGEPLTETEVSRLVFDPATHEAIGYSTLVGDKGAYVFFDPADQKAWRSVVAVYPGQGVELLSMADDHRTFVVAVDSPTEGVAYALVNLNAKTANWLGTAYAGIEAKDIAPKTAISYQAADGLQITGYLTVPSSGEARNLPLIVLPHGGPAARDTLDFDFWSQALAARGYAVLQPNFRGSEGFGRAFLESGHGEWGKKMQTDLSDGVRHLAAQGTIDSKRVCIVGASYGGYAALAGAAIDRGVYRCAVSVAGPSDLKRMLVTGKRDGGLSSLRYWSKFMGVDGVRDPDLALISPASQAAKVDIPLLLIHGKDDVVVAYEQSTIMVEAMRRAGKPVELVTLDGEDHWLSRGDTRLQMLESTVAFVEKHNPPNAPTQTASAQ